MIDLLREALQAFVNWLPVCVANNGADACLDVAHFWFQMLVSWLS